MHFFFASFAVHCVLCDAALILKVQRQRKGRNEPQRARSNFGNDETK